ncbi:MAG: hypothetical protein K6G07_00025 [Lachnospiraceae bacterium]|nr:hypothetical protein [Lachnospiraceae bacterium]
MKKRFLAIMLCVVMCASMITGCGATETAVEPTDTTSETEEASEEEDETEEAEVEEEDAEEGIDDDTYEKVVDEIDTLGDVDVVKEGTNVKLTIPAEYEEGTTQEMLDEAVKKKGYKSATLNDDGSVTYEMTKSQHREILRTVASTIDESLADLVGSDTYPNITDITANSDYTEFKVTTKNEEPDITETYIVVGLYIYGGMYGIYNGQKVDNIHVDFLNDKTKKVISSMDSKDMET